jgi:hypothetical protein
VSKVPGSPQVEVWHSWLPLIVPAGARRMRVADPALAATLAAAGAELVDDGAELEIAASA